MAKSLAQLNAQIQKLQRQAEALRAEEVAGVVARIREAIDYYGLTAADLGFTRSGRATRPAGNAVRAKSRPANAAARAGARVSARASPRKRPAAKKPGVIRFRDDAGNAWTGHGKRPNWFKAAIESGKTPEDLAVNAA